MDSEGGGGVELIGQLWKIWEDQSVVVPPFLKKKGPNKNKGNLLG